MAGLSYCLLSQKGRGESVWGVGGVIHQDKTGSAAVFIIMIHERILRITCTKLTFPRARKVYCQQTRGCDLDTQRTNTLR